MKRLWIKNEDGLVDVFNVRKHVLDYKPEGFDEKTPLGPRYIEVIPVEDHERIVAELKAEYEQLQAVVTAPQMQYEEEIAELRAELDERTEQLETTMERYRAPARTIASQKCVIAILKQQRNVAHERARVSADEMMQFIQEDDAEIAAIEKGEA